MTQVQKDAIKAFFGMQEMTERAGVNVHDRAPSALEVTQFTEKREKAYEVALTRGGEFLNKKTQRVEGAYCSFRTSDGQTGRAPVRDPKNGVAKFAKVFLEKKGEFRPIVNQQGEIMPNMVYEITEDRWSLVSPTGTVVPSADLDAESYEAQKDLESATKRADIRKKVADRMAEMEALVVVDIDAMARARMIAVRGYTEAEVAAIVI